MENKGPYYITTAIAYTSGKPHIGNVYEVVLADAIARYKRLTGYDVRFQTGTDEHGQKVEEKALAKGVSPKEFCDEVSTIIRDQFDCMNCSYDYFIRTTDEYHEEQVQKIFKRLYDQGDIYKGTYEGMYCKECQDFFTKSQLKEDNTCPTCSGHVHPMKEEAYFFRMSNYADRLMKYIDEHPHFIQPESRKNEMLNNFLRPGLQDLCVTRTSFKWGIPVDFDPEHVIYVWIDALTNYITGLGYQLDGENNEMFEKYWPCDLHLVGKDIIRFHTIYWPIMLMALDLPLPKQIFGHPWLLTGGDKMSKSHGNVIYADDLKELFGQDAVRYIMLHEMPFAQDGHVTYELMVDRINATLANNLGNLVNRTISMQNKYFNGVITNPQVDGEFDADLKKKAMDTVVRVEEKMNELRVADAINEILSLLERCNKYIDETTPWILAKDPEMSTRLATVLYNLLEGIRIAAVLLKPFLPATAEKILDDLNTKMRDYDSVASFGLLEVDQKVVEKPEILFQRLDEKEVMAKVEAMQPKAKEEEKVEAPKVEKRVEKKKEARVSLPTIEFEDFKKIEMRVGKVITCSKHPNADSLLVETIDLGDGDVRQIVSGIANSYTSGQMIGKSVIVVCNLKPVKIRGVLSEGMILAGKDIDKVGVAEVNDLEPGTRVE